MKNAAKARSEFVSTAARSGFPPEKSLARKMSGPAKPLAELAPQAEAERPRISAKFDSGAAAKVTLHALCELADNAVQLIFGDVMKVHETPNDGLALLALGGYGRGKVFSFSALRTFLFF